MAGEVAEKCLEELNAGAAAYLNALLAKSGLFAKKDIMTG